MRLFHEHHPQLLESGVGGRVCLAREAEDVTLELDRLRAVILLYIAPREMAANLAMHHVRLAHQLMCGVPR